MPHAFPIEVVHLAHTLFPDDPRVKREATATTLTGRRVAVVAVRGTGQRAVERLGPLTVIRLPGAKSRGGPLSYLREYANFAIRCRRLLAADHRFTRVRVVHVHTLPDFLVWAARPTQLRGSRVILDLHEIFPEFARAKYVSVVGGAAAAFARWIERWARRRADVTITVNAPIDALLASRPIGRPERRIVIHNSADPDELGPEREPKQVSRTPGAVELVYHGSLTPVYGLEIAIAGVARAGARGLAAGLTIVGDGADRERLRQLALRVPPPARVSFEPRLPQAALSDRLTRADAGIIPTQLNGMTRYSLSNKLFDYVHLGLPVITARLPSYVSYLPADAAWYWTPDDADDLARALTEFGNASPPERADRACRARTALAGVAWPNERARLIEVYRELLGES